jgi:N-acyl-D-amino-acid deacylase
MKTALPLTRRRFVAQTAVTAAALASPAVFKGRSAESNPTDPRMASFDREVGEHMKARNIPGGALAVVKDGRLVYARGYGWADRDKQEPVEPASLFRIASISKPVTAVAVLKQVEQGRLKLSDKAFDFIDLKPHLPAGAKADERLRGITIRQCLDHTGGWDRDKWISPRRSACRRRQTRAR